MKTRILRFLLVTILIATLSMTDFLILGQAISTAVYEELENQTISTSVGNVDFDAYFMSDGSKVHRKENGITQEDTLILNINVKNQGVLNEAKIKIENANFEIQKDKVQNSYVKNVNLETNEIELNQIVYKNNIEIGIPVKFKKQETLTDDYFEKENTISISGTYENESTENVTGQIKTRMIWKEQTDVNLAQEIEKYLDLGENGVLLQQKITTQVPNNILPRKEESLKVNVPEIDSIIPESVTVLVNGDKLTDEKVTYNKETKQVEISNSGNGTWGKETNEYKIIYLYSKDIAFGAKSINLNTTMTSTLYTQEAVNKEDIQTVQIEQKGNVVSDVKTATNSIYKGYMYANVTNETLYSEYEKVEISDINSVTSIEVSKLSETFIDAQNNSFDVSLKNVYKSTVFNKENLQEILGTDGVVTVKDSTDTVIATINKDTQADENGNIVVNYTTKVNGIKIITTKPVIQGNLEIQNNKAIEGNTGYTKEQLKTFTKLSTKTKITTNLSEEISEAIVTLEDTKTEAKIEINNNNLSTLQDNENIQMLITLKSNTEQFDLYKNPTIEVILPKEINATVGKITQLNGEDQIKIASATKGTNQNGEHYIRLTLEGEQVSFENELNEGIQITIPATIIIDKETPTKTSEIKMNYTNENRAGETFTATCPINLNSKYGVLLVNKLSGYNSNGDSIENIDDKLKVAQLDVNVEEKVVTQEIALVNNYENEITNITFIGKFPNIAETDSESTFDLGIASSINVTGKVAKIYYSEDIAATSESTSWLENVTDFSKIKAFKIVLEENSIKPQEVVKISYNLKIPANLGNNTSAYSSVELDYGYLGNTTNMSSNIKLQTANVQVVSEEEDDSTETKAGLSFNVIAKSGGKTLTEGDEVYEGQGIEYEMTLVNNTDKTYNNIYLKATNSNAIYYGEKKYDAEIQPENATETVKVTKIEEDETLQSKEFDIESIAPGETKKVTYQISVKEVEGEDKIVDNKVTIKADEIEEKEITGKTLKILQGELKLSLRNDYEEEIEILTEADLPIELTVKNISGNSLKNVIVELPITDEVTFSTESINIPSGCNFIEYKDEIAKFSIEEIAANGELKINVGLTAKKMDYNAETVETSMHFFASVNENKYNSNEIHRTIYQYKTSITAVQTADVPSGSTLENGNTVKFTFDIENKGIIDANINIIDEIPDGLVVKEAYFLKDGNKEVLENDYNSIDEDITLKANEKISLVIETYVDTEEMEESTIENYAILSGMEIDEIETNKITYNIKDDDEEEYVGDGEDGENGENSSNEKYTISGTAWIDGNQNGMMDQTENKLSNVEVILVNVESGKIVTDDQGNKLKTTTQENGEYQFNNLNQGNYMVIFKYDAGTYRVTEYQKEGISETMNSDVIGKKVKLEGAVQDVAITGTINLTQNAYNIDAGFITREKFDLKLDKYISKLIIQDSSGTKVTSYNGAQLVRTEIDAKRLANATVIIEYNINVTNQGDVAGYASEIVDYIPADLKFISDTNKDWYQGTDGYLHTKALANQIINPGESKVITLTLVKTMTQNNTGTSINTAEIAQTSNNLSLEDIDSTPANKVTGEDDMSTAEAIISIRTGAMATYITLTLIIATAFVLGIYIINKRVLKEDEI